MSFNLPWEKSLQVMHLTFSAGAANREKKAEKHAEKEAVSAMFQ